MSPLDRETASGRRSWVGWVNRFAAGSGIESGGGGEAWFIVTSGASSRERSSVGASEGRVGVRCWVGVSGEGGDISSGGAGSGGGEGLGSAGWRGDAEEE